MSDLPPPERQVARFADALEAPLRASAIAGASVVGGRIWPGLVDGLVARTAKDLVKEVRTLVTDIVAESGGQDNALEAIRSHYREVRTTRLTELADNALAEAFGIGAYQGIDDNASVIWAVDQRLVHDDRFMAGRPCLENAAGEPRPKGTPFPSGAEQPPCSTGCRWRCSPVSKGCS